MTIPLSAESIEPATIRAALADRPAAHSLPGRFYTDPGILALEFDAIWHQQWVFVGHECELAEGGAYITLTIGSHPIVVVRGDDGELHALHNVCRHRGSILCDAASGTARRRLVCPYHQWSYEFDGRLARARSMADDFDPTGHSLGRAHVASIGGLVFVCLAETPPDLSPMRAMIQPYLEVFDLRRAVVAHSSTIVEHGNWKLVMENNRECYHCRAAHPELCLTFPEAPLHSGGGDADELQRVEDLVAECEALGLPSRFMIDADHQYRVMRMPFLGDARSMTLDGRPAVGRRFGSLPDTNIGDVLLYHYPSTWNHFTADHAVTFRAVPTGPTTTELRTTWLVPAGSVAGVDYDLERLTEVWLATNAQDTALVERTQRGVISPAYRPGPYAPIEEEGVIQFVDWYATTMLQHPDG